MWQAGGVPGPDLAAGLAQYPFADGQNQAGLLGHRDEPIGADPAQVVVPPPQPQRFTYHERLPDQQVTLTPEETRPPEADRPQRRWMLQMGAFRNHRDADRLKARLALLGVESRIVVSTRDAKTWNLVRVGPFDSRRAMGAIKSRVERNGINPMAYPVD